MGGVICARRSGRGSHMLVTRALYDRAQGDGAVDLVLGGEACLQCADWSSGVFDERR